MKILEEFDEDGVILHTIGYGDLFVHDGGYYMRCEDFSNIMNWKEENKNDVPIVDMASGRISWLNRDTKVPPIYARIRINGRAD